MKKFIPLNKIHSLEFGVNGDEEIKALSEVKVSNKNSYKDDVPYQYGYQDLHMGTTDIKHKCLTCKNRKKDCPGHFGHIELNYPVKSPIFKDKLLKWLKIICSNCGNIVLNKKLNATPLKILSEYVKNCREVKDCQHCGAPHPKIVSDVVNKTTDIFKEFTDKSGVVSQKPFMNHEIEQVLQKIPDRIVLEMGIPLTCHPKKFILHSICVPPTSIRPDVRVGSSIRAGNSINTFLRNILTYLAKIPENIASSIHSDEYGTSRIKNLTDVDMYYMLMVKGNSSTSATGGGNRDLTSIASRHPGKGGRMRKNLNGRRTWLAARSVIICDTTVKIDEIGIPLSVATNIQIPEIVQPWNYDRMIIYLNNKKDRYPGCSKIVPKTTGIAKVVSKLPSDYKLQIGDIVYRDMIDGDIVGFNRQPTLSFSSIGGHKIKVMPGSEAFRMNISACHNYGADFDGDAMLIIVPTSIAARCEMETVSSFSNWFMSFKNSTPLSGCTNDAIISGMELTTEGVDICKYVAMQMFSNITLPDNGKKLIFNKENYSGRELVSFLFPNINVVNKRPQIYDDAYTFVKYNTSDTLVNIDKGNLLSGVLDKKTIGQDQMSSIFHIIYNEYGAKTAFDTIYTFSQLIENFMYYRGYTIGIGDIIINKETQERINDISLNIIEKSREITNQLDAGQLIPPVGLSTEDYYEHLQSQILLPKDEFILPILESIDFYKNNFIKLVFSGSKGKKDGIVSINASLGQTNHKTGRAPQTFSPYRTSPYFERYSLEPTAMGYIVESYYEGMPSDGFMFSAQESRASMANIALSTAKTGAEYRNASKNFEPITIDNYHRVAKTNSFSNILSMLYGDNGIDPRYLVRVKLPTLDISDDKFNSDYDGKNDEEFEKLKLDRINLRECAKTLGEWNPGKLAFEGNSTMLPFDPVQIINDVKFRYSDAFKDAKLDKKYAIDKIKELCGSIAYIYMNNIAEEEKAEIPKVYSSAIGITNIVIRSYLCTKNLEREKINNNMLDIICQTIKQRFEKSIITSGLPVGIIAAMCLSEPLTQYLLDSKHRAGLGGSKTEIIDRFKEIIGAKPTDKMNNPTMAIYVKDQYSGTKLQVQEIANHIELIQLNKFLKVVEVFVEDFGTPVHPDYVHEKDMIAKFVKHNKAPSNLSKFVIRLELSRGLMIIKSVQLEAIILALKSKFRDMLYIVHTSENIEMPIIRCYITNTFLKKIGKDTKKNLIEKVISDVLPEIKDLIIRGIEGITRASVKEIHEHYEEKDGSMKTRKKFIIETDGTNLEEVMEQFSDYIDPLKCHSDSLEETYNMYGIFASRSKIITELHNVLEGTNRVHKAIYADEMTYNGHITSIEKTGLGVRDLRNITLRASFQFTNQVFEQAASHGFKEIISGITGPLIVGRTPEIGTVYNKIVMNTDFIMKNKKSLAAEINNIE